MSDFLLDLRNRERRQPKSAIPLLSFFDDLQIQEINHDRFRLTISRPDDITVWGVYQPPDTQALVALAGRIALERTEWDRLMQNHQDGGGLACRFIYGLYKKGGSLALSELNGHYVALIFDDKINQFIVATDRCGMVPCFMDTTEKGEILLSSHPDILAQATGRSQDWDMTSMAEFLITGRVSFPYTYYRNLEALDYGSLHIFDLNENETKYISKTKFFDFNFTPDSNQDEWSLAEELAQAFRKSVHRRTHPIFGQTAISLSGGLDSRTLLCSLDDDDRKNLSTFYFFDEENFETSTAKAIAKTAGVRQNPLKRDFDYYGNNAEMGVRISGGMGDISNNHHLGFRKELRDLDINNIIAGFYCDYLFKGLVLNKKTSPLLRVERLSDFDFVTYSMHFWPDSGYVDPVRERLNNLFPEKLRNGDDDNIRLESERRRFLPFSYEPDNQETTVPQRVLGWYLPTVDNDVINTYLKIPPKMKLNASIFSKVVQIQCGPKISAIPNTSTGARVGASWPNFVFHQYARRFKRRFLKKHNQIATDVSWPNWDYYVHHSRKIAFLWHRNNSTARDLLTEILGYDPFSVPIQSYRGRQIKLFTRILTLKIWIDQRG